MKGDKKTKRKSPRPPGVRKAHRNITEAVQSQAERQQSSELNQAIIASATEGICACHDVPESPYVRFTVWNDRMTEVTGYTMEEINTSGWYQTVYPDPEVQARAKARMDRMRQGDNLNQEGWEITRKDGQKRQILISTRIVLRFSCAGYHRAQAGRRGAAGERRPVPGPGGTQPRSSLHT